MKTRLYITLEGGLVSSVTSNHAGAFRDIDVVILDYDTEGADETELAKVRYTGDENRVEAVFNELTVTPTAIDSIVFDMLEVVDDKI